MLTTLTLPDVDTLADPLAVAVSAADVVADPLKDDDAVLVKLTLAVRVTLGDMLAETVALSLALDETAAAALPLGLAL